MVINGSMHKTKTWIDVTSAPSGKGANHNDRKVKKKRCLVNSHQTISHQSQLTPFLVNSPYIWNKEGLFWGGLMVFSTYCGTINLSYMLCRGICLIWLHFKTIKAYFNYKLSMIFDWILCFILNFYSVCDWEYYFK